VINARDFFATPHDCPPGRVFVLTAYLDESGHEGQSLMVLAGFLGSDEQWKRCEEKWRINLGNRKHLHMRELQWSKRERIKQLLDKLGPVPHEAGLQVVFTTAAMSDYSDIVTGTQMEWLFRAYMISLMGMIHLIADNIPSQETFKLVLEANDRYTLNVQSLFKGTGNIVNSDGSRKLISIEQVPKGITLLTQPADYLAYALLQQERNPGSEKHILCAPILQNVKPALGRRHEQQPDLVRDMLNRAAERFPNLMRTI
jgi:hypothetical protein